MNSIKIICRIVGSFLLFLCLFSCNVLKPTASMDDYQPMLNSAEYKQYQSEVIGLKSSVKSPEEFDSKCKSAMEKCAAVIPTDLPICKVAENPSFYAKTFVPQSASNPPSLIGNESVLGLNKAASTGSLLDPVFINTKTVPIKRPYWFSYDCKVPPTMYEQLEIRVTANEPYTDPFVVAYRITSGGTSSRSIQSLEILGYNDDANGTLNSSLSLIVNKQGVIIVLVFPYSGEGTAKFSCGGTTWRSNNTMIGANTVTPGVGNIDIRVCGVAVWGDNGSYIFKNGTASSSLPSGWTPYIPNGATFITDNLNWGSATWGAATPKCTGDSYLWAFNLSQKKGTANDDYLGLGSVCYLDPSSNGSFPASRWYYPNVVLLGGYRDGGEMTVAQMVGYLHQ